MKKSIIRFTTKMGMTAYPSVKMQGTLAELRAFAKAHPNHESYTYSIEHTDGMIYTHSADYHHCISVDKA